MRIVKISSRVALMAALTAPVVTWAQDRATPGSEPSPSTTTIESIVVTAQRREESLQEVPLSVTALTGEMLLKAGITDTRQLTQAFPGLVFSRVNSAFQPYIRGVGTRSPNAGDEANISLYIDGVYQPVQSSLGFDLVNVERVEVLRGPQGTLFGRNSTGGLINVITPDPSQETSGRFVGTLGNFGERSVQGYFTTGLTSSLSFDVSASHYEDDGFVKDLLRGGHLAQRESELVRAKLLFEPGEFFRAVLAGSYTNYSDNSSVSSQPLNGNTAGRAGVPTIIASNPWEAAIDNAIDPEAITKQVSLQTRFAFDAFNIETTSAYIDSTVTSGTDSDGTPKPIGGAIADQESDYTSNEVRALSSGAGAFSWIIGAFHFSGHGSNAPLRVLANGVLSAPTFARQEVESYALFGEGTVRIGEHVRLTGGLRYTDETRNLEVTRPPTIVVPLREASFDKLTYRATAQYMFNGEDNVYLSYSRGFKSGVFNTMATTIGAAAVTRPETLDAVELGVKLDPLPWLRVNASIFRYDYTDIQQTARDPATTLAVLLNAANATVDGAELELTVQPIDDLSIRAYGTYLDAQYDSFPGAQIFRPNATMTGNVSIIPFDAAGTDMIRAPRSTFGLNVNYSHDIQAGTLGISGNVYRSAKYYWDFENRLTQPAYTMLGSEVSFSPARLPGLRLSLWGRNLTDEVVYAQMTSSGNADVVSFERPRSYGASVAYSF